MTEESKRLRGKRLPREILGLLSLSFVITLILFLLLRICATAVADSILVIRGIVLTESKVLSLEGWMFNLSLLISVCFFTFLFLFLLGERLSYIWDIIKGIDALRLGEMDHLVSVEGNNELTRLAEAVNYLSITQKQVKEKERLLAEEKEQLIRTLSHDIRTPLTSIMAYSEFLAGNNDRPAQEQQGYAELIRVKAQQIKELTDILLDGGRRNPERFEDSRLLMEQLVTEFEELLEEDFQILTDLKSCFSFSGSFDIQELRRIFDNLSSNIRKYADPLQPVFLSVRSDSDQLVIYQKNYIFPGDEQKESYQMGLNSIRRIAHNYAGTVDVRRAESEFEITITLLEMSCKFLQNFLLFYSQQSNTTQKTKVRK